MKSNSSFLIVKKLIQVLFLRVYKNISAVKAVSIHSCFSTCGRISFFFPGDIIWVWFSSFKNDKVEHVLLYYFLNDIFWSFIKRQTSDTSSDEWQTTSDKKWQRVTKSDNKWQWVTASEISGTVNENDTVHFKEWMIAIILMTKRDTLLRQGVDGCNLSR